MAIYRFRVAFEDFDDIIREIDIKTNQTFEDLHRAIHRSTGYNADKASSFYASTDNWIKGEEITIFPNKHKTDNGVKLMGTAKLSAFVEDPHQKFYYTYNFDRPFYFHVELIKIILENNPNLEYPFLVKSVGEAPKIYDKPNLTHIAASNHTNNTSDFDFLNEMNFVAEDLDELDEMDEDGIHPQKEDNEDEQDEFVNNDENDFDDYNKDKDDY